MFLIFDTETTGLPKNWNAPVTDLDNWPRLVQLAWQLHDEEGQLIEDKNYVVTPDGFTIPYNSIKIHHITMDIASEKGIPLSEVLKEFDTALAKTKFVVGHNVEFDLNIMGAEYLRSDLANPMLDYEAIDTKDESIAYCALPGGRGGQFKWPKLEELHEKLFGAKFAEAHNAAYDVEATTRCFLELVRLGIIDEKRLSWDVATMQRFREVNPTVIEPVGIKAESFPDPYAPEAKAAGNKIVTTDLDEEVIAKASSFSHLHCHSQFSVLQSTSKVKSLVTKAKAMDMPAIALTDHGNMFGAFVFVREALAAGIKPVVGCELNVTEDRLDKTRQNNGSQQVLLAKNKAGYENLIKLCSMSYTEGFYYVPRIDKALIEQYKENLIATTGGLWGEIPYLILNVGEQQAEEAFLWWKEQFGEDFYVELNRHSLEEEQVVNETLLRFCKKHDVKYFAANSSYYDVREDAVTHDILLCVKDAESVNKPKKYIGKRGREFRYGFPNDEFYIKSTEEMAALFSDMPEALATTAEIIEKVEPYKLQRDVLLPKFDIPAGFETEDDYLRHLTYEGAKGRYPEITDEIRERLDFELATIKNTGYPGYFLIVQDFTSEARKMGVSVGPGRGSAAGSAVAYCTGITNVDPIKYDLLFERFLNPDRISLPDIDIDFDDEGRDKIIKWVTDKYGKDQVAQIITYGTMAAKSSIRDAARVMELPLGDADRLAKLMPDTSLAKLFGLSPKELSAKLNSDQLDKAKELIKLAQGNDLSAKTMQQARKMEGSVRNTGIHACGVIITPAPITNYVPIAVAKDSDLPVTQFDNSVVESAGMLKMDFLGLKTLTIIKDAIKLVEERHGVKIDPDEIDLSDQKTYELYQRGETNGTFQFESAGMQKYLKELVPDKFGDLIAMNALYRPGPLEYIPNFVARKQGREPITYDLADMEGYLAETYGITVYQEQVMLLSQKLAGFTKGQADMLRKGMGKKKKEIIDELKPKFLNGCEERGHDVKIAEKVWKDWEAFAAYAFNKSHSTCYSVVAFHTGFLKANYPPEYMASVLTHNMSDIKKVTFFMEECQRMGIPVLGPDINESAYKFTVNDKGEIRFGLGAIKGVGGNAVDTIVADRKENGLFNSVFDLVRRVNLRTVNKKNLENLALAGAFDSFDQVHRASYFVDMGGRSFLENVVRYGSSHQENENSAQASLFGGGSSVELPEPPIPHAEPWGLLEKLNKEKELVGIYISGHPLDDFKFELNTYCNTNLGQLQDLTPYKGREVKIAGIASEAQHRVSKNGKPFGSLTIEDYNGSLSMMFFSDDYLKYKSLLEKGYFLYIVGSIQARKWGNTDELEFKVTKVELLSELRSKLSNGIKIRLAVDALTEELIKEMEAIFTKHPGPEMIQLSLFDVDEKIKVDLFSANYKIDLNNDVLAYLDEHQTLKYELG